MTKFAGSYLLYKILHTTPQVGRQVANIFEVDVSEAQQRLLVRVAARISPRGGLFRKPLGPGYDYHWCFISHLYRTTSDKTDCSSRGKRVRMQELVSGSASGQRLRAKFVGFLFLFFVFLCVDHHFSVSPVRHFPRNTSPRPRLTPSDGLNTTARSLNRRFSMANVHHAKKKASPETHDLPALGSPRMRK